MWLHNGLRCLICRHCPSGLTSQTALGHLRSQHSVAASKDQKDALTELCKARNIHADAKDVVNPKPGGPPIPGIAPPVVGHACNACEYRVVDSGSMVRHGRVKHGGSLSGQPQSREAFVQCIFAGVGRVYFEVDPHHAEGADLGVRVYLRAKFLPGQAEDPLVPQDQDRDRPPLLKITMWDEFEPEVRKDETQRKLAAKLKSRHEPCEQGGIFVQLANAIVSYHRNAKLLLKGSAHKFTICKVLMNGPGFSPDQ